MFRFLKEIYLTGFTLGFRFRIAGGWGRWIPSLGPIMDAGKGVFFVSVILFLILDGIESLIEIFVGTKFSFDDSLWGLAAVLALYYMNYYVLVTRGHGIKFEREFTQLKKSRKVLLVVSCAILLLATTVFTYYSVSAYQSFFHVIPKSGF
jgi:hypothetical protein